VIAAPQFIPWAISSLVIGAIVVAFVHRLHAQRGFTDRNFAGRTIPTSVGLAFGIVTALLVPQSLVWQCVDGCGGATSRDRRLAPLLFVACVTGFSILGLIDDRFGSKEIRGLRGHFKALFRGVLTTGAVKALGGAVTALLVASVWHASSGIPPVTTGTLMMLDGALIALGANALNLLDRRPSRALKAYWLSLIMLLVAFGGQHSWMLVPLAMATLAYAPLDFRCQAMMGDAGSNALGAALGSLVMLELPIAVHCAAVCALLLFNLGSERISYTKLIDNTAWLRWLDRLGTSRSLE